MARSSSSRRSGGSSQAATGGASVLLDGKNDRYSLMTAMQARSSATSRSAHPETSQWTLEPPSSSAVMSSPTTAFTSGGPPSAMWLVPLTMGTKSASAGMYAVPAAPGPIMAATCGTTPE